MDDRELFDRYRTLLGVSAKFHEDNGNAQLGAMFRQAQGRLRDLLQLRTNHSPVVAFVGLTNVGKSTLLSALFGAKVAPAQNRAWSSVPVEYRYGDEYEASADFANSITSESRRFQDVEDMLSFISMYATVGGAQDTSALYARMPSEILKDGLVIADTPGFGAATVAGGSSHEASVKEYIPHVDYVFWVISSTQGITRNELDFYRHFLDGHCENIVVNCFDEFSEEDKRNFERINGNPLGARMNWYFVDAKAALRGKLANDDDMVEDSGIAVFEREIRSLSPTDRRLAELDKSVERFFDDISRFRDRVRTGMFFAEHVRLELELTLANCEATPLVKSALKSIARQRR